MPHVDVPVFVTYRDRRTMLNRCLASLQRVGLRNITVIDNDSQTPYVPGPGITCVRSDNRFRHLAPWGLGLVPKDDYYIVCDCDVEIDQYCPENVVEYMKDLLQCEYTMKVGLGIETDDLLKPWPPHYTVSYALEFSVPDQYDLRIARNGELICEAATDTHFAMYRPGNPDFPGIGGIRTTEPYLCRHLPWYNREYSDEERLYYARMPEWAATHSGETMLVDVVVPFTQLHGETVRALMDAGEQFRPIALAGDDDYFEALNACWESGHTFINVEHDIVVGPDTIKELRECPEDWCSMGYPYRDDPAAHGLACTKFSDRLIKRHPGVMDHVALLTDITHPPKHWCRLCMWISTVLETYGEKRHEHAEVVGHVGPRFPRHGCE